MSTLHPSRLEMVEAGGRTAQTFGLSRLTGQIYMLLYLEDGPKSLDDVCDALDVSKASVSIACRQLEGWGGIKKVWVRGDRKDYYEVLADFRALLDRGLFETVRRKLESARQQIQRSVDLLEAGGEDRKKMDFMKQRLDEAEKYRSRLAALIDNPVVRRVI